MENSHPIDFVVTWVDDSDPVWRKKRAEYTGNEPSEGNTEARYRDWDNLKYWFRGVEKFAPWVRYVYFVTDNQKPEWLNTEHPKLRWVKHTDFIPEEYLPTFNCNPIELNLHRIDGLSENFVYFNDDIFIINRTQAEDFFVDGLPCDLPNVGCIFPVNYFSNMMFNNTMVLNRNFSFRKSITENRKKWYSNQSVKEFFKLLWYGCKEFLPGVNDYHIHKSMRKDSYTALWEKEGKLLDSVCKHKQRTKEDLTILLVRAWQLMSGKFHNKKPIGKAFATAFLENGEAIAYLTKQKGKVICLNDSEFEKSFELHRKMLREAFQKILPEKSSFEL